MSFNAKHRSGLAPLAATTLNTLVAGTVVTANPLATGPATIGSVSAFVTIVISTGSLTLTPKWQMSEDGVTYSNVLQATLPVISASGTYVLHIPGGAVRYIRLAFTTAGATGGAADTYAVTYSYNIEPFYV